MKKLKDTPLTEESKNIPLTKELKDIAVLLNNKSIAALDKKLKEAYFRSACNRVYYACFLLTRKLLKEILDEEIDRHADVPRKILDIHKKSQNPKNLNEKDLSDLENICEGFREYMHTAKRVRNTADYDWDKPISDYEHCKDWFKDVENFENWFKEVENFEKNIKQLRIKLGFK